MHIIYDGYCSICTRFKRFIDIFDRSNRLAWTPFQEADFSILPVSEEDCLHAIQVIDDESVFSGFHGVRRICRELPLLWPAYLLLSVPGVPFLGVRAYRSVADRRHCTVPQT